MIVATVRTRVLRLDEDFWRNSVEGVDGLVIAGTRTKGNSDTLDAIAIISKERGALLQPIGENTKTVPFFFLPPRWGWVWYYKKVRFLVL